MFTQAASYTRINLEFHGFATDQTAKYYDIYKNVVDQQRITSASLITIGGELNNQNLVLPTLPIHLIQNESALNYTAKLTPIYLVKATDALIINNADAIQLAFDQVGVERANGNQLINLGKGILAEMSYKDIVVAPSLVEDPEEDSISLTIRFMLNVSFEESLVLDTKLTKEMINRANDTPDNLLFAVYPMG
ncbi:hypothetical protein [Methylotenera versatilis]|uniref:Uncharacterized protein n=1 Tax=Methylotenera versatilis (strain 301) TaxID=666681 RepID=D7DKE1_METV0|nr:hypothetical protein [Methylotenera versatilis]ADI28526.1 hypothetical protein M301_0138 [Methylotenera versatilis 301]